MNRIPLLGDSSALLTTNFSQLLKLLGPY